MPGSPTGICEFVNLRTVGRSLLRIGPRLSTRRLYDSLPELAVGRQIIRWLSYIMLIKPLIIYLVHLYNGRVTRRTKKARPARLALCYGGRPENPARAGQPAK